jgi:hypothetical protein
VRRNASTVVVLASAAPAEVLAAVGRSMNVSLIRLADPGAPVEPGAARDQAGNGNGGALEAAAAALKRAGQASSPYALVPADPLAAVAASWRAMWDVSRPQGPARFEREAARALAAWRAGMFELPDYYLVLGSGTAGTSGDGEGGPDFYLGPVRSVRPHRVAFVAATQPVQQAVGVLTALGSLRHGPWWPGLDQLIYTARDFYPDSLAVGNAPPSSSG